MLFIIISNIIIMITIYTSCMYILNFCFWNEKKSFCFFYSENSHTENWRGAIIFNGQTHTHTYFRIDSQNEWEKKFTQNVVHAVCTHKCMHASHQHYIFVYLDTSFAKWKKDLTKQFDVVVVVVVVFNIFRCQPRKKTLNMQSLHLQNLQTFFLLLLFFFLVNRK